MRTPLYVILLDEYFSPSSAFDDTNGKNVSILAFHQKAIASCTYTQVYILQMQRIEKQINLISSCDFFLLI